VLDAREVKLAGQGCGHGQLHSNTPVNSTDGVDGPSINACLGATTVRLAATYCRGRLTGCNNHLTGHNLPQGAPDWVQ